jgi:hypothetical protein
MKKIFGVLITSENAERIYLTQKSLYEKISKTFDEFFIINLINFKLFKKKTYKNEYSNSVVLPYNFKIITPVNEYELNKLLINKNLVAFDAVGKRLSGFRIRFLIKKYNVRLIQLQNIGGVGNQYLGKSYTGYRKTKLFRFYLFRLEKIFTYFLLKVLIFLNLFSRTDIYFESDKAIVNNCNNSLAKKIEKIFPFLKICYFKKTIRINSRAFDMLKKFKPNLTEDKIVFIDSSFDHGDRIAREGKPSEELKLKYFNQLNQFFLELSSAFNKKVVICLHPNSDINIYKKYFGKLEIHRNQLSHDISQAFIVIFHLSTSISDAILLKKKIICLKSNILGEYYMDKINFWEKRLGVFSYSLDEKKEIDNNLLLATLENKIKNYDNYINTVLKADDSILGEDMIIDIVRKEYFVNNTIFK